MLFSKFTLLQNQPSILKWAFLGILTLVVVIFFYFDYQNLLNTEEKLKNKIQSIEHQLSDLPRESLNSMPWTLGYRSPPMPDSKSEITITITFHQAETIDSIIILPATYTEDSHQLMAFGFPKRFYITNLKGDKILIDYRDQDYSQPGIEPQIFNLDKEVQCDGIKLITTELVKDATWWSDQHNFSLSEIYVFHKEKNISLGSEVAASHHQTFSYIWNPSNLSDGFSLFSPVIRKSIHPLKYTFMISEKECQLIYLNKTNEVIDEARLWPILHSLQHNYPPSSGLGFPKKIKISTSNDLDFKDSEVLYVSPERLPKPGSNPFCIPLKPSSNHYYLFELSEPLVDHRSDIYRISLAEIQLLGRGKSISSGNWQRYPEGTYKKIDFLNDGYSNEGKILPLKESLLGLNLRAKLEKELDELNKKFNFIDGQKNEKIRNLVFVGFAFMVILILMVLIVRYQSQKSWHELRETIAADLHDEVGANLSSIGQYNDLLKQSCEASLNDQQIKLLDRTIDTIRETSKQTRHLISFLEQKHSNEQISLELEKVCHGVLPPTKINFDLIELKLLDHLKHKYQWHFLMFFKEALNNIRKHAHAKFIEVKLNQKGDDLYLMIADNGIGFNFKETPPLHLNSRSQKLDAEFKISSQMNSGTELILKLQPKHFQKNI